MLTKVILEGILGNKFGRVWNLFVNSPSEAIRLIDANRPGIANWIKSNTKIYDRYRVVCTYENGQRESLSETTYGMLRRAKVIRFIPIPEGASGGAKVIIGAALIAIGYFSAAISLGASTSLVYIGMGLIASGVAQILTPTPKKQDPSVNINSTYFNGAQNTSQQGSPVPIVYGRILVGSHAISASMSIDKLM